MGSLARQMRRAQEREAAAAARRDGRRLGKPLPPKHKRRRGGTTIRTPRVGVSLTIQRGLVQFRCPSCRQVLYTGTGTPRPQTERFIESHVPLCQARLDLISAIELWAVVKLERGLG